MESSTPTVKARVVEEKKRLWDNYKVVAEVQKSDNIKFVIGAGIRDGVRYINIREFYHRKRDDVWNPGRDGITIPVLVPVAKGTKLITPHQDLLAAMANAITVLEEMPLSDINNAIYVEKKVRKKDD